MRTQSICLALGIVLVCSFASAQWMQTGGPTGGYVTCVAAIGGTVCAGTGDGDIFISSNNAENWTQSSFRLACSHGGRLYLTSFAFSGNTIFAATDNGVARSTDNGANWSWVEDSGLRGILLD